MDLEGRQIAKYYALREDGDGRLVPSAWQHQNRYPVHHDFPALDQSQGAGQHRRVALAEAMAVSGAAVANNLGRLDHHISHYHMTQVHFWVLLLA